MQTISDVIFCSIWLGSTMFALACLSEYLGYGKCSELSHTIVSYKMASENSEDPDQTAPGLMEQSDKGLHSLPFHYLKKIKRLHK